MEWFCLFCFASLLWAPAFAAPPPTKPLADDIVTERLNSSLPLFFNLSSTPDSSLLIQKDPWDMHIIPTIYTLEWYAYRAPLDDVHIVRCVNHAREEAADRLRRGDDRTPMSTARPYTYNDGDVNLWLEVTPGKELFWGIWARVLHYFRIYILHNEWRGAQFLLFVQASGAVFASGHLLAE